ncbi:Uncharacterized protein TCM_011677 [Theobroma cacao]|uniref:Uncharacterized protein n=1 Tax=Theobroma cacao TaxID=3641 RepID=A0A061EBW0_THECC|nr:Uncharacterized protein TCM_011677 [Theobroma cacao]
MLESYNLNIFLIIVNALLLIFSVSIYLFYCYLSITNTRVWCLPCTNRFVAVKNSPRHLLIWMYMHGYLIYMGVLLTTIRTLSTVLRNRIILEPSKYWRVVMSSFHVWLVLYTELLFLLH